MSKTELYLKFRAELDKYSVPVILKSLTKKIKIKADGKDIGLLCLHGGYIDCLYIIPSYRRQGHARKAVSDYIEKYGMPTSLHIINSNVPALKFWNSIFHLVPISWNDVDTLYEIKALRAATQL